jgi:hypothetical protein
MNILIKLSSLVGLAIAPLIAVESSDCKTMEGKACEMKQGKCCMKVEESAENENAAAVDTTSFKEAVENAKSSEEKK